MQRDLFPSYPLYFIHQISKSARFRLSLASVWSSFWRPRGLYLLFESLLTNGSFKRKRAGVCIIERTRCLGSIVSRFTTHHLDSLCISSAFSYISLHCSTKTKHTWKESHYIHQKVIHHMGSGLTPFPNFLYLPFGRLSSREFYLEGSRWLEP
jgi:hypothetical protein